MAGTLDILGETRKELEEWECNRMDILVATSFTDGTLVTINFSDTIGHSKHAPKPEKRDDSNCIWLDPEWRENSDVFRSNTIIPFLCRLQARLVSGSVVAGSPNIMSYSSGVYGESAMINIKIIKMLLSRGQKRN